MWANYYMKPRFDTYHLRRSFWQWCMHGTCKLPHYFQSHIVVVLTQLSLRSLLQSADYTGRIAKWGTILGAFDIKYMPRTSVKG